MGRKPLDLPEGVEIVGKSVRIRFTWRKQRRCETLACAPTPAGILQASNLRAQVKQLIKLDMLDDDKYAALFPASSYSLERRTPTFGEYAQIWLDSREIVKSSRNNYKSTLQRYWMPHFSQMRLDLITPVQVRRIIAQTDWSSPQVRRNARDKLSSVLMSAMLDGIIPKNPVAGIERPKVAKKVLDPFTREEAELIVAWMYRNLKGMLRIYACFFEFAFFTGMRPGEQMALKWSEIDFNQKTARVCRIQANGNIHERVKTKVERQVLLNERALHALNEAKPLTMARSQFAFAPAQLQGDSDWIRSGSTTAVYFDKALRALGIRQRRQYDTRHTYATMCLMAGMNPAFVANQLGHSVQMLLSTYAKWLNSTSDWTELEKLETRVKGTKLVQPIS